MEQEEKQRLIKDICARLPYGIFVKKDNVYDRLIYTYNYHPHIETCKPYLRKMSSMTEDEEREYNGALNPLGDFIFEQEEKFKPIQLYGNVPFELYEFFNSHHFDYRGLIEKGLALEAPKDMYKTE